MEHSSRNGFFWDFLVLEDKKLKTQNESDSSDEYETYESFDVR